MKKIIFSVLFAFVGSLALSAQCTPDTTMSGVIKAPAGSKMDTVGSRPIVILPYAQVNQNYSEVLHFKIPKDTTYNGISATVDSVKLLNIMNLPSNFSLSCTPAGCVFPGESYGCAQLQGTPTTPDSIELEVVIEFSVTIGGASAPIIDTLGDYYLVVKGDPMSINEADANNLSPRIYPNPANEHVFIELNHQYAGSVSLEVMNLVGRKVFAQQFENRSSQAIKISTKHLNQGVYLYHLRSENKTFTGKFSISR